MNDHPPQTMHAAYIEQRGDADAIHYGELPTPAPGPDEVLIRTEALAVNHVDTFVRSGAYRTRLDFPFVVGRDVVGTIAVTGARVAGYSPGDRVWSNSLGLDGRQGSFSDYVIAPIERLYRLPASADPVDAVSVLHTLGTAYLGLCRESRIQSGETVFIGGAGGGVGSAAVQLASGLGADVVASASPGDFDWVRACGARAVIDYHDPASSAALSDLAPGGLDVHWDCSGHYDFDEITPLMRVGGRIVLSAGLTSEAALRVGDLYTRDIGIHGFAISNAAVQDLASAAEVINEMLDGSGLLSRVGRRLPLRETARAHHLIETESTRSLGGRIVVVT